MELFGGMREACDEYALWLVGGDLSRGRDASIAVTVTGEVAPGKAILRSGARAGDRVVVTGELGGSAAGLRLADVATTNEQQVALVRRHLRPTARVGEGGVLAAHGATAMMDVSDGLTIDLARLARASRVGATVALGDVPVADGATLEDALGGGEDYELLAALPDDEAVEAARGELKEGFGVPLTQIGRIVDGEGLTAIEPDGTERPLEPAGWDHFR
jgi:thiamine-monophosphate kinase